VEPDPGHGRGARRGPPDHGRPARGRSRAAHHHPVPAADQAAPEPAAVRHPGGVRRPQGPRRGPGLRPRRVRRPGPLQLPRRRDAQGRRPQAARRAPRLGHRRSLAVPRRLILILVLVVAVAWLGFRAVQAFDQDRRAAQAAAGLAAPDKVTHDLLPVPVFPSRPDIGPSGRFVYRPRAWLSVVDLRGPGPEADNGRYLVFLRNWAGWTLAGAARPAADGTAQIPFRGGPPPPPIHHGVV